MVGDRGKLRSLPHRQALALAVPAIASNVAVPLVGLIDTAVIGHFATVADLGAVGIGAAVVSSLFWIFAFLRPGTTSLVGRALGAGDKGSAIRHVQRALGLALAMGAAWVAVQWLIVPPLVRLLAGDTAAGPIAAQYALVRGLSLPAVLVTLAVIGYFIGAQDTRTPLAIAATVAAVNIVLAVWAVAGLGYGAVGTAWATFGAEWVGALLAIVLLRRHVGRSAWAQVLNWRDPALRSGWRTLMAMNGHLVIRTGLLVSAVTVTASLGSRFGPAVLAANAILLQMMHLASYALDGYATAAEAMSAQEIGRADVGAFHRANGASAMASAAIAAGLAASLWLGRDAIVGLLTGLPDVAQIAREYWWVAVALPLVSFGAWLLDGIFLGAGRSRDMMIYMTIAVLGVFVPALAIAATRGALSNTLLWSAFLAMNATRATTLAARYVSLSRSRRWLGASVAA
jgi:MATE family multidrug resistance protein